MADDITWVTVNGQHIPIGANESKEDAISRAFGKKESDVDRRERQLSANKKEADRLNEGRVESTQDKHSRAIEELSKDKYEDGTYDTSNLKPVEYENGYQVTFCQIGDNYSAREYDDKVNEFLSASSDGRVSAGKFEGTPEISFHVNSCAEAIALAQRYNQISIWDWQNCNEIKTGGTGRRS